MLGLVLVALVGAGGWWVFSSQSGDELTKLSENAGAKLTDAQVDAVVSRISKFMVVPEGERPSVVVLKDTASLAQQQAFYKDAKDGDILIVYSTRAIIYDAKANKLVSVSPIAQNTATPVPTPGTVASGSAQVTPTATPPAPEKVTLEVRNGTTTTGLAGKTASDLKTKFSWITATKAADAAKSSYTATVLVDMSGGKNPGAIAALEQYFSVKAVTALPTGEATSTSNILVIVGK
jgi:hypothetical protein